MKREEQLQEWIKGNSIHNKEIDECCPDFSCCGPQMASLQKRGKFVEAYYKNDNGTINSLLIEFLSNAFKSQKCGVVLSSND